jgi:hypothetical protein
MPITKFLAAVLCAGLAAAATVPAAAEDRRPALPGGIGDKPYLSRGGVDIMLGGYMDHEFEWVEGGGSTFDQHRFVPFITARVSDRVTVSSEIEFEHGGFVGGGGEGEIKLEYAVMDYRFHEGFQFRGGLILSPLGAFNLRHDTPLNDLAERPLVDRQLIPSTLSESGMGVFGTLYPDENLVLGYEAYLVNGFDEGVLSGDDGAKRLRIRSGRGSQEQDNNRNKALVARLGASPRPGLNLGASVHTGKYDDAGGKRLTIAALDGQAAFGSLELLGELAFAAADVDRTAEPGLAESQRGAYGQVNWHVLYDRLLPGSVVTLVARADALDYDTDVDGDQATALTLGVNFRPTEESVFKLDYAWSRTTARGAGDSTEAPGRLFFSVATYF